jgi:deoxyribodipyrimidine photo-lyase
MTEHPAIVWFRDDLRLADNPALSAAAQSKRPVIALYVLEDGGRNLRPHGGAGRWWLAGSLRALSDGLRRLGLPLILRRGQAEEILLGIARETNADTVYWNRRYGPAASVDRDIEAALARNGIRVETFAASLLFEPGKVQSKSGAPMRVFTPFWRAALALGEPRRPLPAPKQILAQAGIQSDNPGRLAP